MTKIIRSLTDWKPIRQTLSGTIGFVPTMGNLHEGHVSLLQRSKRENTVSILSIFVNPTQFNNENDFTNYPKTLEQDITVASPYMDYILVPQYSEIYTDNYSYKITCVNEMTSRQEAACRLGHFDGVLTVVMKLLQIVKPTHAYFGEKDYQQLQLITGMVKAFFMDTEIIPCSTIRNKADLPLSSRNNRLTKEEHALAERFSAVFHSKQSCEEIKQQLIQKGLSVDYVEDYNGRRFAAVKVGNIRLIDNFSLTEEMESC